MEVSKKKTVTMESLIDLENQERQLRIRLERKRTQFDGETILKGDAVESIDSFLPTFLNMFCET